eukprot:GHVP01016609.1.p1 GENE.GHVP01016609.1~~GHVP01016609.1.p1  ORF type:complete len:295 (+),score=41.48 GHVP01016609.1:28-912(+)
MKHKQVLFEASLTAASGITGQSIPQENLFTNLASHSTLSDEPIVTYGRSEAARPKRSAEPSSNGVVKKAKAELPTYGSSEAELSTFLEPSSTEGPKFKNFNSDPTDPKLSEGLTEGEKKIFEELKKQESTTPLEMHPEIFESHKVYFLVNHLVSVREFYRMEKGVYRYRATHEPPLGTNGWNVNEFLFVPTKTSRFFIFRAFNKDGKTCSYIFTIKRGKDHWVEKFVSEVFCSATYDQDEYDKLFQALGGVENEKFDIGEFRLSYKRPDSDVESFHKRHGPEPCSQYTCWGAYC